MNELMELITNWLADYYLLSSVLLALTLAATACTRQPARRRAVAQSTIAGLVLLGALCSVPGWSTVSLLTRRQPEVSQTTPQELHRPLHVSEMTVERRPPDHFNITLPAPPIVALSSSVLVPDRTTAERTLSWSAIIAVIWAGGLLCVLSWLALGSFAARRMRREACGAPRDLLDLMNRVAALHAGTTHRVELLVSNRIEVAVALGIWRPAVLLPASWVTQFPLTLKEEQENSSPCNHLHSVLVHELAHIENRDLHWLAASRALVAVLWAQPLYWLLRRRLRLYQEALADAAAAEITGRQRYAEQLVDWARNVAGRSAMRLSPAVGLWECPSQLRQRVALLVDERLTFLRECSGQWKFTSFAIGVLAALVLSLITLEPTVRSHARAETEPSSSKASADGTDKINSADKPKTPTPRHFVRLVLDPNGELTFEGEKTSWDQVAALLEKVPNRSETVLEFAIASEEISVRDLEDARSRAMIYVNQLGFQYGSYVGVHPLGSKGSTSSADRPATDESNGTGRAARTQPETSPPPAASTELVGTVHGPDGTPLAGVTVDAWTWYSGNETTTDRDGRFRLTGFEPSEEVEVEFRKEGYGPRLFVAQMAGTREWVVAMDNRTYFEGRMVDPQDNPVAGAVVRADRGPFQNPQVVISEVATETTTDQNGNYRLHVAPDTYDIKILVPGRGVARYQNQKIAAGETKRLDTRLDPGITFRANIVDSETGEPVEGITLWSWRHKGIEGTSNADGLLEIPAMFPGNFEFNVSAVGGDRTRSSVAGNYARWWSDDAIKEHQRPPGLDRHGFQRNFDDLEFEITEGSDPVNIEVEPCVTITGRVVDPDGRPVAGATVAPAKTGSGNSLTGDTRFSYETKQDGTFEMRLPAGGVVEYNLIAHDGKYREWRKWANATGKPFRTNPGDRIEGVELRLARPAIVRGRVNSIDGKPIVGKEVRAADFDKRDNRYYHPTTKTDDQGRFELKFVGPGKHYIQCEPFWLDASEAPPGTTTVVEVQEGAMIEDIEIGNVARSERKIGDQSADNDGAAHNQNGGAAAAADDDDEHGSQMLRDIRAASAPILAAMAKNHGYGLEPGRDLRRVAPPFPPIRMEYYRTGHPSQSEAIKEGPSAMVFRLSDGKLHNWGMTFGGSTDGGYSLTSVLDALLDIKSQQIDGPRELRETRLSGDWVIREGAAQDAVIKHLQDILQNEFSVPVKLEFREVEREVYVARGEYELTPLPGQEGKGKLILTDETITTDEIQIFGTDIVPNSGAGGGTGEFEEFLGWLGRWIGTPIVSEVDLKPSNQVSWHLHERSPSTEQTRSEDHDAILVLGNITLQTGLTFSLEKRPVRILFVERTQ